MIRFLLIIVISFSAAACMDSNDDDAPSNNPPVDSTPTEKSELDPTASLLEKPPVDGKLPADLKPPV